MNKQIAIIGAGGFGKEVRSLLKSLDYEFMGFIDDNQNKEGVTSSVDSIILDKNYNVCIAIGSSAVRESIFHRVFKGFNFPNLLHPKTELMDLSSIEMGCGNIICANSIFTCNISIGDFSVINLACTVGHDVIISDFCSLMPSVNISGNVKLERGVFIGSGATILPGVTIGENAIVGAGAVVTKNVAPNQIVVGIPAKSLKKQ